MTATEGIFYLLDMLRDEATHLHKTEQENQASPACCIGPHSPMFFSEIECVCLYANMYFMHCFCHLC